MKEELHSYCGTGVRMEGVLRFRGALRFDGDFKGEIDSPDALIIGKGGQLEAKINVGSFFNMGEVNGIIHATRKITMHAGSRLIGDIDTPSLVSEEGALFNGQCKMAVRTVEKGEKEKILPPEMLAAEAMGIPAGMDLLTGEKPRGKWSRKKIALASVAGVAALVLVAAYYLLDSKTSMGASFLSRYMYERAAQDNPARLHAIADAYFTDGSYSQAARVYRRLKELTPSDPITVDRLAVSLEKSGETDEASAIYEEQLKANPHDKAIVEKLVSLYNTGSKWEKLEGLYEKMISAQPDNTSAATALYKLYMDNKKLDKALDLFKTKIASSPMSPDDLVTVGNLEKQLGKYTDAIATFAQLVDKQEDNKEAVLKLGYLYHKTGQEDKALVLFGRLVKLDPNSPEANVNLGLTEITKGHLSRSVEIFNGVLTAVPDNTRAMLGLATAYSRLGDYAKAEQYCRQILALDPDYAPALNKIARIFSQQKRNLEDAEKFSLSSMKYDPNLTDYMDTLSDVYYAKQDYEKAVNTMSEALKLRPNNLHYKEQLRKFTEGKKQSPATE